MREQGLTTLFFIAGAFAGVIGMHALGFRASSPASATASPSLRADNPPIPAPTHGAAEANGILAQGLELGQLYQRFARELDESGAPLPTVPAYNAPAPMGEPPPPAEPADSEPIQPLQPTPESGIRTVAGARVHTIPPFMRDALKASEDQTLAQIPPAADGK